MQIAYAKHEECWEGVYFCLVSTLTSYEGPKYMALSTRVGRSRIIGARIANHLDESWVYLDLFFLLIDKDLLQHTHWTTALEYTLGF